MSWTECSSRKISCNPGGKERQVSVTAQTSAISRECKGCTAVLSQRAHLTEDVFFSTLAERRDMSITGY